MPQPKRIPVPEEDRAQLLLWCARHCCFCGKPCTTNIVIHHIDGNPSNNDRDNLIPICCDCHGELERYNPEHPVGTRYCHLEIKKRREQIYDLHTVPYLRQVDIRISKYIYGGKGERPLGDTSCTVRTLSADIPIRLGLAMKPYQNKTPLAAHLSDLYSGNALWNLNPSQIVAGYFSLPISRQAPPFLYRVEIFRSIVDVLDREHEMLPFSYVWSDPDGDWWYDPRVKSG